MVIKGKYSLVTYPKQVRNRRSFLLHQYLGDFIASGGFDRTIMIWQLGESVQNVAILRGHTNAILQLKWSHVDRSKILTASADRTLGWWDVIEGERIKNLRGHTSIVNACATNKKGSPVGASGADDGTVKLWDLREKKCVGTLEHSYQILSVEFSESDERIFAGTIDDSILVIDPRMLDNPVEVLSAPGIDSVTGISVSHDGDSLLSLSMNGTAHLWDVRPFCPNEDRCLYTYSRITNNYDWNLLRIRWSPDDLYFSVGSSENLVSIHKVRPDMSEMDSLVCSLPGHGGTVSESIFHPKERYSVLSASSDRSLMYGPVALY
jgi:Prp8 binding protein